MSHPKDSSRSSEPRRSSSASCKPLLDVATPELFRTNAFRITGLRVDATMREIARHTDKLKMMEELGQGKSVHTGAFALKTPPSLDQIRAAIQRLKEPEQRIIDEFFWFWPRQFGQSASDPAIIALEAGDADTALEIWESLETHPDEGVVAIHNIAVLWHCMALEWERHYAKANAFTKEQRAEVDTLWRGCFKRWNILAVDDVFWAKVSTRIKDLDDPRLTTGFARRMRTALPQALCKMNAELAVRYAESGDIVSARVHAAFMKESHESLDNIAATVELVLAPATERLQQQTLSARNTAEDSPGDAGKAAADLLKHAQSAFVVFALFSGYNDTARRNLFDDVAEVCTVLLVTYRKASDDSVWCLEIGSALLDLVSDADLRRRCEENISAWRHMVARKLLEPLFGVLHEVRDSEGDPRQRLRRFDREMSPLLSQSPSLIKLGRLGASEFYDEVAFVLRSIALDAWNKNQDKTTALSAIEKAIDAVVSSEILNILRKDIETINALPGTVKRAVEKTWSEVKTALVKIFAYVTIIGVCVIIANSLDSCNLKRSTQIGPSATTSSYAPPKPLGDRSNSHSLKDLIDGKPSASPARPWESDPEVSDPAPSRQITRNGVVSRSAPQQQSSVERFPDPLKLNSNDKLLYSVPQSRTAELAADSRAIDTAKSTLSLLSKRIDNSNSELSIARAGLDRTDRYAVERFNRKLDGYNAMIEQFKTQQDSVNRLVEAYNDKLRRYGR